MYSNHVFGITVVNLITALAWWFRPLSSTGAVLPRPTRKKPIQKYLYCCFVYF